MIFYCRACKRRAGAFITQLGLWSFPDGTPVWQCAYRKCSAFGKLEAFQLGSKPEGAMR